MNKSVGTEASGLSREEPNLKPNTEIPGTSSGGYGAPDEDGVVSLQLEPNKLEDQSQSGQTDASKK